MISSRVPYRRRAYLFPKGKIIPMCLIEKRIFCAKIHLKYYHVGNQSKKYNRHMKKFFDEKFDVRKASVFFPPTGFVSDLKKNE